MGPGSASGSQASRAARALVGRRLVRGGEQKLCARCFDVVRSIEDIWREYDEVESRLTAPVSERMLELADLRAGMRVLDLATGRGEPALRAAARVGPGGRVVGIELVPEVLQIAREKAEHAGLENLELHAGDAERLDGIPSDHFHAATIRWALMFMKAPVAALEHARRALVATGVLIAAFWAEPDRVPWSTLPRRLLARYRTLPGLDPEAPGTFRYADIDRIVRDFDRAGFAVDHIEEMDIPVFEADTAEAIVAWERAFGLTQLLADLPDAVQRAWEHDLATEMERNRTGESLRLGGVTRIVRARPV
jgi:ubiquinone/menaquinone biosynthesis C-methylase UbiE